MQRSLIMQLILIMGLSLILAIANNLRPSAKIEWVRDWPPYSALAVEETVEKPEAAPVEEVTEPVDQDEVEAHTAELVTTNAGITDIGLEEAYNIFRFASDYTLWIDARSPELFEEGHIKGSHLLHLYEKNTYLPQVVPIIEEMQPAALIIYCKGKDCTDSHHLAQDLEAQGYGNIFVYKDGFDDWYKAGYPIEGALAEGDSAPAGAPEVASASEDHNEETAAMIMDKVASNFGITDIGVDEALEIYKYASDLTFWIDARSPELYEEGHIKGSHLLYFYDMNTYLDDVKAKIAEQGSLSLVIYCKGKDCTDSHHLAQDLQGQGFENIFVYKDGFQDWYEGGHPIEGALAAGDVVAGESAAVPVPRGALEEEKPPGMYVEHIVRDMVPFLIGMIFLAMWPKLRSNPKAILFAAVVAGGFFIYAAAPKIATPMLFAKNIWNYDIVPGKLVNFSGLLLPMVELVIAIAMISGVWRRGGSLIMSALLVIFIVAVSFNVLRGHEFDCGCTASEPMFPNSYWEGWNDKYTLILRDIGLLVLSMMIFMKKDEKTA